MKKKLRSNKQSEKYFNKQEGFAWKLYLQFNYKQILINIHYISFTQNCFIVYKRSCTKCFFLFHSGHHIVRCDPTFISTGVEFALPAQHETFSDSGIQLISDINDLDNKSRRRHRTLSLFSMNSIVTKKNIGKLMFHKEMDFHPNVCSWNSEMSGLLNFSVRVQSWSDKIESDPVLIRKIFENHLSYPVLIRPCKIMCFYFVSWGKTTNWGILPSTWLVEGKIVPAVLLHHETK